MHNYYRVLHLYKTILIKYYLYDVVCVSTYVDYVYLVFRSRLC